VTGVALALLAVAAAGLAVLGVEGRALRRQLSGAAPSPRAFPGISVLKPLRGVDDDLEANLASFAALSWPEYEVLLGLHDDADPAGAVARAAVARWPGVFRVVPQSGELGMNPKVSQLASLSAAARHAILVVSDSNVRVEPGYLAEIAARLEDPAVGLVTHLIAGVGERSAGALLENLHLAGGVATGIAAAKQVAGRDVVMGKSMAFRAVDLAALGGLEPVKDLLAEDFVIGQMVPRLLGKRVELASRSELSRPTSQRGMRSTPSARNSLAASLRTPASRVRSRPRATSRDRITSSTKAGCSAATSSRCSSTSGPTGKWRSATPSGCSRAPARRARPSRAGRSSTACAR